MRLFIAVDVSDEVNNHLEDIQKSFNGKGIRLTSSFHITLKFLGEVQDETKIIEKLDPIRFQKMELTLDSLGVFPNKNYIKVLWVGVSNDPILLTLQKNIDKVLPEFKKDHEFHPHITLARVKFLENKEEFIKKLESVQVERIKFKIEKFVLYKSKLTKKGPIYVPVKSFN